MSGFVEILIYAGLLILTLVVAILEARFYLHMLQLSSYQFQGYGRFIMSHPRYIVFMVLSLAGFIISVSGGLIPLYILFVLAVCVVAGILHFPKKAKKKLVVTARVKRLIAIVAILCILMILPGFTGAEASFVRLFSAFLVNAPFLLPMMLFIVPAANLIAMPVERWIQRWYINDARRMLKEHPGLRIIGITGSFGKTSVKHYLTEMLTEKYSVLMTPGSFNTPMGVVRTIRESLRPTHEIFVCEMGARHVGDIKEICDIVNPDDGIITALGDQHLETFHTRENIIRTKYELLDAVDEKLRADKGDLTRHHKLVNGDDEIIAENRRHEGIITYGLGGNLDYRGEVIAVNSAGTTFRVTSPDGESEVMDTPLVGRHNIVNILGAIAMAHSLGVTLKACGRAARRLKCAEHRLEIKKAPYGVILDDAYNSNPAGAKAALETLKSFDSQDLKIIITPGMVELGEKQAMYNAELGAEAAGVCDYIFAVGRTNSEAILRGARETGFPDERLFFCTSLDEAMNQALTLETGRRRAILLENDLTDDY